MEKVSDSQACVRAWLEAEDISRRADQQTSSLHVLLAFFTFPNRAQALLIERGIDEERLLDQIRVVEDEPRGILARLRERARDIARSSGGGPVDCLHVLIALTRQRDTFAYRILERTGVSVTGIRNLAMSYVTGHMPRRFKAIRSEEPTPMLAGRSAPREKKNNRARTEARLEPRSPDPAPVPTPVPAKESATQAVPGVIARKQWTRHGTGRNVNAMNGVKKLTIHHEGWTPVTFTSATAAYDRIENIRQIHTRDRGWADIGYHYAIDPAGRVYEARPTVIQGAHVKYNNEGNLGILVMGNYQRQRPTDATMRTLERFVVDRARAYRLSREDIHTHRELRPTACPGRYLQRHMESVRARGGAIARAMA